MRSSRFFLALTVIFTLMYAGTALARPQYCELVCEPGELDNVLCTCNVTYEIVSCGEYHAGGCDPWLAPTSQENVLEEKADPSCSPVDVAVDDPENGICWAASWASAA